MASPAEVGRQLEQQVAAFFHSNGYTTRCNVILEGRTGGRHEIDVLAEKSDALTTYRVAIECKAWQHRIEKDVVSKLHYVLGDLGLNKGIIVSLSGGTSGAERAAHDLGIELWGPNELRRHLGEAVLARFNVAQGATTTTLAWGYQFAVTAPAAEKAIRSSGKGRFNVRMLEALVWFSPVWLPAYRLRLTVAQPDSSRFKARLRSTTIENLYEAMAGGFLARVPAPWEQVTTDRRLCLPVLLRDSKLHGVLLKEVQDYRRVTSPAAVQRHAAQLGGRGIPVPCSSLSVDDTALVYLPYYVGVLEDAGRQRAVAVSGRSGDIFEPVSHVLTTNLGLIRTQFGA